MELQKCFMRAEKKFTDAIRDARQNRNDFHHDLAKALGVSTEQVRNYISGKTLLKECQSADVIKVFEKYGIDKDNL